VFTEVARRVYVAPLFSPRETEAILAISKRRKFRKGKVYNRVEGTVVKREIRAAGVQHERDMPQLAALLRRRIIEATLPFSTRVMYANAVYFEGLQLIRYKPGGFYHAHKDNFGGELENAREVTLLVYLNDDFKGGETSFPKLEWAFTPRAGHVLVFPSRYRHRAEPVIEGTKYVIAAWYQTEDGWSREPAEPPVARDPI